MKKKIICMGIILLLMLLIPFFTIENKDSFAVKKDYLSKEQLTSLIYREFRSEYNVETLKVLSIILQTNYTNKKSTPETMTKKDFYKKFSENADEYNKKISIAVNETHKKVILCKDKKIHIPYCYVLNDTSYNSDLENFKTVATPWDCLKAEYKTAKSNGISMNSVNNLCKNGFTYMQALNYFLSDIKITLL